MSSKKVAEKVAEQAGWGLWKRIGCPKYAVAPMVHQSELAFRMLTRKYDADLCFTPMLHSRLFVESEKYRQSNFHTCPEDRPLFVQFCGDNEHTLLKAAKYVEDKCDAVDLNLGCPQGIARKGHYGAFLLEEPDLLQRIVSHLSSNLKIPVTCKIRLLKTQEESVKLAKMLVSAGCQVLTIHGRTKEEKKQFIGKCDWDMIRAIREAVDIPVIANGGIARYEDIQKCLDATKCHGVMSSEAVLENPSLFVNPDSDSSVNKMTVLERQFHLTREFLDMSDKYPLNNFNHAKRHIIQFLFGVYMSHKDMIEKLFMCYDSNEVRKHLNELEALLGGPLSCPKISAEFGGKPQDDGVWYARHRNNIKNKQNGTKTKKTKLTKTERRKRKRDLKQLMKMKRKKARLEEEAKKQQEEKKESNGF